MPQPLDPNGFQPMPTATGGGTFQLPPAAGILPGGIGAYARQQGAQQHSDLLHQETESEANKRQERAMKHATDDIILSHQLSEKNKNPIKVETVDDQGNPITQYLDPSQVMGKTYRTKPTAQELASLEATKALITDLPKLEAAADKIRGKNPSQQMMAYLKYAHPTFGMFGTADPEFQDYFAQVGNIKSELAKLQASGSSRAMAFLNFIMPHIPSEKDPPSQAIHKMQTLEKGRFDSLTKAILGPQFKGLEMKTAPVSLPPASMIPEGMEMKFSNGKTYQKLNGVVSEVGP